MEAVVRFVPSQRDCFCAWRTSRPIGSFCLLALITSRERTVYVVANAVHFSPSDEVLLGAMFAAKQGLVDGDLVHVMFEGQLEALPAASRVAVTPETPDDWELLESNQDHLCRSFLAQCCCVWPQMRLPLWVDDTCLLLRVTAVSDARPEFAVLREHSEVAVEPPGRPPPVVTAPKVAPPLDPRQEPPPPAVKLPPSFLSLFLSLADFVHFLWRGHTFSARRQMAALGRQWAETFALSANPQPMVGRLSCSAEVAPGWPLVLCAQSFCGFARARVLASLCEKVATKKQKEEALSVKDLPELVVAVRSSDSCPAGVLLTNQLVRELLGARTSDCIVLSPLPVEAALPKTVRLAVSHDLKASLPAVRKTFLSWLRVNFSDEKPLVLSSGSKLLFEGDQTDPISCDVTVSFSRVPPPPFALLTPRVLASGVTRLLFDAPSDQSARIPVTSPIESACIPLTSPLPPEMLESSLLDAVRRALQERQPIGAVVCGPAGSGRSTLVAQVTTNLGAEPSLMAHCAWLSCREWRSKILDRFRREASAKMQEALWRRPSVLVLDDVDVLLAKGETEHEDDTTAFLFASFLRSLFDDLRAAIACDPKQHQVALVVTLEEPECLSLLCAASATFSFWLDLPPVTEAALRRLQILPDPDLFDLSSFAARLGRPLSAFPLGELKFLLEREAIQPLPARCETDDGLTAVGGLQQAKLQVTRCVLWPRRFPEVFALCPLRPQRGLLLFGPSGCGKTRLAHAVAAAASMASITVRGPELLSKFIGASEANVRQIFRRARLAAPCLLFFDEFDALAPRRGHDSTGVTDRVVNQLLTELDGAGAQLEGVFVMAASNRPELIDPALLRPGRLDQLLFCDLPDEAARREIGELCYDELNVELGRDSLGLVARGSEGFTGADLRALLLAARIAALRRQGAWNARRLWRNDEEGDAPLVEASEARVAVRAADVREAFGRVPGSFGTGKERERAAMEANFAVFRRSHGAQENPEEARVTLA